MPELDDFLGTEPEEEKPVAEAAAEPEAEPEATEPEAEAAPEEAAKPEAAEEPEPKDVAGMRAAMLAERTQKKDHKGRADRLEGEMTALREQLEALKKAPPSQPVTAPTQAVAPPAIPNPVEDPQGYHAHIQQTLFNDRLNMSEAMLRQAIGNDADVDAKREKFRQLAEANPSLRAELQKAAHPYKFVYDIAAKAMALDEIGDPAAYRTKLEAEIRASVMAEMGGTAPAAAPRVQLPQSLGTARSASPRNAAVINAPESFDDILATVRK